MKTIHHSNLLDGMTCAVIVLDDQLNINYMNQSAEVLFSQSLHRISGSNISAIMHNQTFNEQLTAVKEQRKPHAIRAIELVLSDEHPVTLDCIATPYQETEKPSCEWLLLELHHVDRQLKILREKQLTQQQQALHELVRGLAHEIKNPLGGLRGAAQLLESELTDPSQKEYTQIIISEADRLKVLVDSLLGPGQLPKTQMVNIHEVLEHVCNLVRVDCGDAISFRRDYDPSLPELQADRGHLVQIYFNIINNAVRALEGSGYIQLCTRIVRQHTINEKRYKLAVKTDICDNGSGVPDHLKDKLFLPMVSGHADGSGLGLAIAQSLLSQQGGMIQYESEPGSTCFSILIPLDNGENNG